jgi:hypothetical protein
VVFVRELRAKIAYRVADVLVGIVLVQHEIV